MDKKWTKIESKLNKNWTKSEPDIDQKQAKNVQKCTKIDSKCKVG